ncbi:MAG: DNA translocase FtsK 4TM domain-containing protein, partial [Planctomycetota bacterium]
MGAQPASLTAQSRPRLSWALPLLPLALSVFLLSGLAYYHIGVRDSGAAVHGLFQGLVVLVYDLLGFVPSFMLCLLLLVWSSIWFISGELQRPWGRLARILTFGLSLALVVNLSPETAAANHHGGLIGSFLATRLISVFGYGASTLLASAVALASVLLATDFFFFRYFDSLSRQSHGLPPQPVRKPLETGVEAEVVEKLRTLSFPETEVIEESPDLPGRMTIEESRDLPGRMTIEEDPLDFAFKEADTAVLEEPVPNATPVAEEEPTPVEPAVSSEEMSSETVLSEEADEEAEAWEPRPWQPEAAIVTADDDDAEDELEEQPEHEEEGNEQPEEVDEAEPLAEHVSMEMAAA